MDTARLVECIPANIQTVDKPSAWIPWIFSVDIANLKGSFLFSFDGLLLKATTASLLSYIPYLEGKFMLSLLSSFDGLLLHRMNSPQKLNLLHYQHCCEPLLVH